MLNQKLEMNKWTELDIFQKKKKNPQLHEGKKSSTPLSVRNANITIMR